MGGLRSASSPRQSFGGMNCVLPLERVCIWRVRERGAAIDFASSANLKQRAWHGATLKHPPSSTHAARTNRAIRVPRQIFAFCALANKLSTFQRSSYSITGIIQILCLLWTVQVNTSQQNIYFAIILTPDVNFHQLFATKLSAFQPAKPKILIMVKGKKYY